MWVTSEFDTSAALDSVVDGWPDRNLSALGMLYSWPHVGVWSDMFEGSLSGMARASDHYFWLGGSSIE